MAYGSILGQNPTAQNTLYNNAQTSSIITANNVQGAIDQLFTSVSNGKQQIASAITDKGVSTSGTDSFATMAENIGKISTGIPLISGYNYRPGYVGYNIAQSPYWLTLNQDGGGVKSPTPSYVIVTVGWNIMFILDGSQIGVILNGVGYGFNSSIYCRLNQEGNNVYAQLQISSYSSSLNAYCAAYYFT